MAVQWLTRESKICSAPTHTNQAVYRSNGVESCFVSLSNFSQFSDLPLHGNGVENCFVDLRKNVITARCNCISGNVTQIRSNADRYQASLHSTELHNIGRADFLLKDPPT
jgi:hypothetical protein